VDLRQVFSEDDLAAIRAAAVEAERASAGEVVPYIVGRCHDYPEAGWAGAALGAVAAAVLAAAVELWVAPWSPTGVLWIALPPLVGAALGFLAGGHVPALTRRLVSPRALAHHARRRAEMAFIEEEVFDTQDRGGVLVLLSLFEQQAVLLADTGARRLAEPAEWAEVVAELGQGARAGRPAQAMVEAVRRCASILERLPARPEDRNELGDEVRLRDD
jgi:putative membrane protein